MNVRESYSCALEQGTLEREVPRRRYNCGEKADNSTDVANLRLYVISLTVTLLLKSLFI